jgi:UDP-N-acetylmuramate dehydrogenase
MAEERPGTSIPPRSPRLEADPRLASWTTFRLGGPCRRLISCETPEALLDALAGLRKDGAPFLLIGGGSNLLVHDRGVEGVVVRYAAPVPRIDRRGNLLDVCGSTALDDLARIAAESGWAGLEFASGIPGTVAGAVVGNAGAFGKQIGDLVASVDLLDRDGRSRVAAAGELGFAYRRSALQEGEAIVAAVRLRIAEGDRAALAAERDRVLALRREKHPDWRTIPSAGSFFKNIEPTSAAGRRQAAGWFLDQAGAKEMRVGGARVFEKHANIIVKDSPDCTAEDVDRLSQRMAEAVERRFGLRLVLEVRRVGFPGSPP